MHSGHRRSGRRSSRWLRGLVAGGLLVTLGAACTRSSATIESAASSTRRDSPPSTEGSLPESTIDPGADLADPSDNPTNPDDDLELAVEANITPEDLPAGWHECCPPFIADPELLEYNTCEDTAIPPSSAGLVREFAFMVDAEGIEQGHFVSQVFVSRTAEDAAAKLSCVRDDDYAEGTIVAAEERAIATSLVDVGFPSTTYELIDLDVADQATVDRMSLQFEIPDYGTVWTHQDSIRMRVGRITYRLLITTYDDPLTVEELEDWAELLLRKHPGATPTAS